MIAVDTNVLLRRLLGDDAVQSERARMLIEDADEFLVTDIVLVEATWTLTGKRYRATSDDIAAVVLSLLEEPTAVFESRSAVWSALSDYIDARSAGEGGANARDFADALIVNKARITATRQGRPYGGTYTFDRAALAPRGTRPA